MAAIRTRRIMETPCVRPRSLAATDRRDVGALSRPRKGQGGGPTHFGLCAIYSGRIKEMWNPRSTVRRAVL